MGDLRANKYEKVGVENCRRGNKIYLQFVKYTLLWQQQLPTGSLDDSSQLELKKYKYSELFND